MGSWFRSWVRPPVSWWWFDSDGFLGGYCLSAGSLVPDAVREIGDEIARLTRSHGYVITDQNGRRLDPAGLGGKHDTDLDRITIRKGQPRETDPDDHASTVMLAEVSLGYEWPAVIRVVAGEQIAADAMAEFVARRVDPGIRSGFRLWLLFGVIATVVVVTAAAFMITQAVHFLLYPTLVVGVAGLLWVFARATREVIEKRRDPRGAQITINRLSRADMEASRRTNKAKWLDRLWVFPAGIAAGLGLALLISLFDLRN